MCYGLHRRRDLKATEIGAAEDIARIWWSGEKTYMDRNSSVETDSVSFNWGAEGRLFDQSRKKTLSDIHINVCLSATDVPIPDAREICRPLLVVW